MSGDIEQKRTTLEPMERLHPEEDEDLGEEIVNEGSTR